MLGGWERGGVKRAGGEGRATGMDVERGRVEALEG